MQLFLIVTFIVYSINASEHNFIRNGLKPLSDEMIDTINSVNATWKAGKNFNGSSSVQIDALVSSVYALNYTIEDKTNLYPTKKLPSNFDARQLWPNCTSIGKVYDQTKGYPSWIYTAVGTIADRLCIKHGVRIDVEATVEHMMKSDVGPNGYNNSADIGKAYKYWAKNGIFTVEAIEESRCLPFSQKCQPIEIKLNRYFKVVNNFFDYEYKVQNSIMMDGPVSAYMEIYSDFLSYKSGIYRRLNSRSLGASDIKIIGWGTENGVDYWLAVNQWGTEWGEEGFFKLLRKEKQLGYVPCPLTPSLVAEDIVQDIPKSYVHGQLFYLAK